MNIPGVVQPWQSAATEFPSGDVGSSPTAESNIDRILNRLTAEAMRPKGYSQSHARKIWKEQGREHARRLYVDGWSCMKITAWKFPTLVVQNGKEW